MPIVLITGASRGLGLEFARQYASGGWTVIATCRAPEKAEVLQSLAAQNPNIRIEKLDVTDQTSIETLAEKLKNEPLDLLINNAGIATGLMPTNAPKSGCGEEPRKLGHIDAVAWEKVLRTNTIAPVMVTEAFLPQLRKAENGKIIMLSSRMGSITDTKTGDEIAYRTSKAALNMGIRILAISLQNKKILVISVNPGWVQTDMGGQSANISAQTSVKEMRKLIAGLTMKHSGQFFRYDGSTIPW